MSRQDHDPGDEHVDQLHTPFGTLVKIEVPVDAGMLEEFIKDLERTVYEPIATETKIHNLPVDIVGDFGYEEPVDPDQRARERLLLREWFAEPLFPLPKGDSK